MRRNAAPAPASHRQEEKSRPSSCSPPPPPPSFSSLRKSKSLDPALPDPHAALPGIEDRSPPSLKPPPPASPGISVCSPVSPSSSSCWWCEQQQRHGPTAALSVRKKGKKICQKEFCQFRSLSIRENNTHCPGGILADDQGLGKTISTIALIQKERLQQSRFMTNDSERDISTDEDDGEVLVTGKKERQAHASQSRALKAQPKKKTRGSSPTSTLRPTSRPAAGTLVVCPASVLKQWANELSVKVNKSAEFSVLVYHGGSRTRDRTDLADYDAVVTTYTIVALEVPRESIDGGKNAAAKAKKKKKPNNPNGGPLAMGRSKEYMQKNYVHILALLSQLRQACNHPFLLKEKQSFDHSLGLAKQLPVEIATNVLENIERGAAKCTITKCRVSKQLPWNNFYLTYSRLRVAFHSSSDILNSIINTWDDHDAIGSVPSEIAPTKDIVFTQWTGMLDLLEHSLGSNHIEFRRLDGSMPLNVRERGVKEFNTDPEEGKRKMIQSALGEDQSGDNAATRLTVEDLRYLFKI
nr:unnamed protein product [Digitaria exilis]